MVVEGRPPDAQLAGDAIDAQRVEAFVVDDPPRPRQNVVPPYITAKLLERMRNGTTEMVDSVMRLDGKIFMDPAIARLERRAVFTVAPFVAAHCSELPNPTDFITKRLPMNEVIIARGADGVVRTFVNQCRHRGATIESRESGQCRAFSCPYHGWSYELDGALRNITFADTFGEVDTSAMGLIELPTEERHGLVWVIEDPDATIDVSAYLGPDTESAIASYRIDEMMLFRGRAFDEAVNWKIMHDAFLDGYHIKFAHPQSANRMVHTNIYVVEDHGSHARFASPRKTLDAWLDHDPGPDDPMADHVMLTHFLGPNNTLLQLGDNYQLLSFYPINDDPAFSRMEMRLIVPRLEDSGIGEDEWTAKWEKNWHILQMVLAQEDFPILRGIQKAYGSEHREATILGRNEVLNQAFHREVASLRDAYAAAHPDC